MLVKQQTAVVKRREPRADGTADSQRDDVLLWNRQSNPDSLALG
jgi:hypothetical protein